ncbi:MAG: pitrilysin family protein [Rickettsiales bacterium]|nr:pitrilysin family protein [Rickettsiales bacterium]
MSVVPIDDHFKLTTLPNGIRVATYSLPHAKSATIAASVGVGRRYETEDEKGISHLIEHMMYRGTTHRSDDEIDHTFASIGAQENAETDMDITQYYAKVLPNYTENVVELLGDVLQNSTFDIRKLKPEKGAVRSEILQDHDDPSAVGMELIYKKLFPNHPLGAPIIGTSKSVSSFTPDDLKTFVKKHYRPDNIVVSAAGNIDHEEFVAMVSKHFGQMSAPQLPNEQLQPAYKPFNPADYHGGDIHKRDDLDQVQLLIGVLLDIPRDSDRYYVLDLYSDILGSGPTSRLFNEARKKQGLVYGINAGVEGHPEASALIIDSAVDPKKAAKLTHIIGEQIAALAQGITEEELATAKTRLRSRLIMASDSTNHLATDMGEQLVLAGHYTPLQNTLNAINRITVDDMKLLAEEIARSELTVATVGDNHAAVPGHHTLEAFIREKIGPRGRINQTPPSSARGA